MWRGLLESRALEYPDMSYMNPPLVADTNTDSPPRAVARFDPYDTVKIDFLDDLGIQTWIRSNRSVGICDDCTLKLNGIVRFIFLCVRKNLRLIACRAPRQILLLQESVKFGSHFALLRRRLLNRVATYQGSSIEDGQGESCDDQQNRRSEPKLAAPSPRRGRL